MLMSVACLCSVRFPRGVVYLSVISKCGISSQQTHNVKTTSYERRGDVITSHRRAFDVVLAFVSAGLVYERGKSAKYETSVKKLEPQLPTKQMP